MIYFIYGGDNLKARHKYDSLIESLLARKKGSVAWKIDTENFSAEKVRELIVARDLFVDKYVIGLDHLAEDKTAGEFLLSVLADLQASPNIFLVLEGELEPKTLNLILRRAEKELYFSQKEGGRKPFNVFLLSDALGGRDRKRLWVAYHEALNSGLDVEREIFWKFQWMIKHLLFFKKAKDPNRSELKAGFSRNKTIGFARNFKVEDLERLSSRLVEIYFAARRGEGELKISLEKFIFEV